MVYVFGRNMNLLHFYSTC